MAGATGRNARSNLALAEGPVNGRSGALSLGVSPTKASPRHPSASAVGKAMGTTGPPYRSGAPKRYPSVTTTPSRQTARARLAAGGAERAMAAAHRPMNSRLRLASSSPSAVNGDIRPVGTPPNMSGSGTKSASSAGGRPATNVASCTQAKIKTSRETAVVSRGDRRRASRIRVPPRSRRASAVLGAIGMDAGSRLANTRHGVTHPSNPRPPRKVVALAQASAVRSLTRGGVEVSRGTKLGHPLLAHPCGKSRRKGSRPTRSLDRAASRCSRGSNARAQNASARGADAVGGSGGPGGNAIALPASPTIAMSRLPYNSISGIGFRKIGTPEIRPLRLWLFGDAPWFAPMLQAVRHGTFRA